MAGLEGDRQPLKKSGPLSRKQEFNSSTRTAEVQVSASASVSASNTPDDGRGSVSPEDQTDSAKHLAHACAQNDPDAIDKINKILADTQLDIDDIENSVRERKAEERHGVNPMLSHFWTRFSRARTRRLMTSWLRK